MGQIIFADRVKETSTTTGTGNFSLAGTSSGYKSFSSGIGDGNRCFYCIVAADGNWEVGLGLFTTSGGDQISRVSILSSSNGDAIVNFGSGNKDVFVTSPAAFLQKSDPANIINAQIHEGTPFYGSGSWTVGTSFRKTTTVPIFGARFHFSGTGTKTIRVRLHNASATILKTIDVTVNGEGVYRAVFPSPYTPSIGELLILTTWDTSGAGYSGTTLAATSGLIPPLSEGDVYYKQTGLYWSGSTITTTLASASESYLIVPE